MNKSYKGKILISTPDLSGDIFSRTVILIIEHNDEGAFGLILNKKNNLASHALKNIFRADIDVYEGGPVENQKTFFIIKGEPITEFYQKIDEQFYITEDIEKVVSEVIEGNLDMNDVRIYSGYSGWTKGQLESEIDRHFWITADVYQLDYTAVDEKLWKKMMQNLGGEFLIWANAPKDISLN